jgi:hypothetical protein
VSLKVRNVIGCSSVIHIAKILCASDPCGYTDYDEYYIDHDHLNHGYYIISYLDITTMVHQHGQ